MAMLTRPHTRFRESFLAAIAEFVDEQRAGEDSMIATGYQPIR